MREFDALWNAYHNNYNGIFRYESNITINGELIDIKNIVRKNWSGGVTLAGFETGIAAAQKFTFILTSEIPVSTETDQEVTVKVRAVGDMGATPYYSFGTYYSHTIKREGNKYTFECLDCMNRLNADDIDVSGMTMAKAVEHFAGIMGCEADVSNIKYDIPESGEDDRDLAIYPAREILGFIASANGGNFIVDFENVLRLIKLELKESVETVNTLNSFKTKKNEDAKTLTGIRLIQANGSDDDYIVYEAGGGDNVLSFFNPLATQDIADNLFTQLTGYDYTPCEVTNAFINPALELGDTVTVRGKLTQIWNWSLSQNLTVSFSAPSNYDKYDKYEFKGTLSRELERITKSRQFVTEIVKVTKKEILAADNIHATSAYLDDLFVERFESNVKNYICRPIFEPDDEEYIFSGKYECDTASNKRYYRRIFEIYDEHLEADVAEGDTNLTADDIEPFTIAGNNIYFTAIADSSQAYRYYTFASPQSKYPDMSDENAALFTVYIKKHNVIRRKAEFGFSDITGDGNLDVVLTLGAGNGVNDRGRAHFLKTEDGLNILYMLDKAVNNIPAGTEIGFKITEEVGIQFFDINDGKWKTIGVSISEKIEEYSTRTHTNIHCQHESTEENVLKLRVEDTGIKKPPEYGCYQFTLRTPLTTLASKIEIMAADGGLLTGPKEWLMTNMSPVTNNDVLTDTRVQILDNGNCFFSNASGNKDNESFFQLTVAKKSFTNKLYLSNCVAMRAEL